jgi:N-methylhydantoinase B
VTVLAGTGDAATDPFVLVEPGMVGWGGTDERNGASVVSAITNGDTFNYSVELLEAKFPLRVRQYALNVAGGVGAGEHRGGFGSIREYEILSSQAFLNASFGRSIERPWGIDGGNEGSCNYVEVIRNGETLRGARMPVLSLAKGDRVLLVTGGGGGYGAPRHRVAEDVAADVRGEYLTAGQAEDQYGVVLDDDRAVDLAATAARRSVMEPA